MKRGELYRVYRGNKDDTKNYRVYLIVSRQLLIDSNFSSVICAPVYSKYDGHKTQIEIGIDEGMKHDCAVHFDELFSIRKNLLTNYVGCLSYSKMKEVNDALCASLELE